MATVVAVASTASVLGPSAAIGSAQPGAPGSTDFYVPPTMATSLRSGDIIRSEDVPALAGLASGLVSAKRIMYASSDTRGFPIATTGIILTPQAPWTGPGSRPLVSYAVGTHGAGDSCAPSRLISSGITFDASGFPMAEYTLPDISFALARGLAVVVTDYQGLGTPGAHTYLQSLPEAHAVLDAARAAIRVGAVDPEARVGIWGYSQGGHAVGAAAEIARTYAPDLDIRGAAVGAPAPDIFGLLRNLDGRALTGLNGFFVNGLLAEYPQFTDTVMSELNAEGQNFLSKTAGQCDLATAVEFGFHSTSEYTLSGERIADVLAADPLIRSVVDGFNLGNVAPSMPVLVTQNKSDDAIPAEQTYAMAESWIQKGADVSYDRIDTPPLLPQLGALGHSVGIFTGQSTVAWLSAQLTR